MLIAPTCPYCGRPAKLCTGTDVYPTKFWLAGSRFWACFNCTAWVMCKPGTTSPYGRLADGPLRDLQDQVYALAKRKWLKSSLAKLDKKMGTTGGSPRWFDEETCRRALDVLRQAK